MSPLALLTQRVTNQKQINQTLTNFVRELYCQKTHKSGLTKPVITQALKQPLKPKSSTSRKEAEKEA